MNNVHYYDAKQGVTTTVSLEGIKVSFEGAAPGLTEDQIRHALNYAVEQFLRMYAAKDDA